MNLTRPNFTSTADRWKIIISKLISPITVIVVDYWFVNSLHTHYAISSCHGGESTLDLCYASSEEIQEWQRPCRATGNCRNLQCGDDSILWANVTRDKGSPCLGVVGGGPRSGGSALLVVGFSVLVSILLCSLSMSEAALSTRLRGPLRFRGSCSWLGECKGLWMVGYLFSCPGCAVTRHLEQ